MKYTVSISWIIAYSNGLLCSLWITAVSDYWTFAKSNFHTKRDTHLTKLSPPCNSVQANLYTNNFSSTTLSFLFVPSCKEHAVNKESKNYSPFRHVLHMQTSDLNVNNTESDHATAIFRQLQDAIFSREHTSVKTSTKIIIDLLQWQEVATLSLPKKAFISTTFRGYFCPGANDIARNRSRVICCRACVDIFRRWSVWLQIIFCTCERKPCFSRSCDRSGVKMANRFASRGNPLK